jgi:hypothetical protein
MSLHDKIMNIRCVLPIAGAGDRVVFKEGHRDARHAAAELALQYDALIEQMAAALAVFVDFPEDTFAGEQDFAFTMTVRMRDMRNARAALAAHAKETSR